MYVNCGTRRVNEESIQERIIPEERSRYSEIDIMEFLGHGPNIIYGTLHYCTFMRLPGRHTGSHGLMISICVEELSSPIRFFSVFSVFGGSPLAPALTTYPRSATLL